MTKASDSKAEQSRVPTCFVIGPIGEEGSAIRKRADDVFDHLVAPVARSLKLLPERADRIQAGGMITDQIIDHILDDDVVVADCHGWNANVVYELSLRHVTGLPVIHVLAPNERMLFDAFDARAVYLDTTDLASAMKAKDAIESQMKEMLNPGYTQTTPIRRAAAMRKLIDELAKGGAEDRAIGLVMKELSIISARLSAIENSAAPLGSWLTTEPFMKVGSPSDPNFVGAGAPYNTAGFTVPISSKRFFATEEARESPLERYARGKSIEDDRKSREGSAKAARTPSTKLAKLPNRRPTAP